MYPYKFTVSLRIWHPQMDPELISKNLKLKPSIIHKAGEPRMTPNGIVLKGMNKENYWLANFHNYKNISTKKISLENYLFDQITILETSASFFRRIRRSGGRIEFFVGIFCNKKNIGAEFPFALHAALGKLGIDLSLDIYTD